MSKLRSIAELRAFYGISSGEGKIDVHDGLRARDNTEHRGQRLEQ